LAAVFEPEGGVQGVAHSVTYSVVVWTKPLESRTASHSV
jgi:hypothetical protein